MERGCLIGADHDACGVVAIYIGELEFLVMPGPEHYGIFPHSVAKIF
jgi:hypothetical protein